MIFIKDIGELLSLYKSVSTAYDMADLPSNYSYIRRKFIDGPKSPTVSIGKELNIQSDDSFNSNYVPFINIINLHLQLLSIETSHWPTHNILESEKEYLVPMQTVHRGLCHTYIYSAYFGLMHSIPIIVSVIEDLFGHNRLHCFLVIIFISYVCQSKGAQPKNHNTN